MLLQNVTRSTQQTKTWVCLDTIDLAFFAKKQVFNTKLIDENVND